GIDKVRVDEPDLRPSARELARAVGIDPPGYVTAVEQAGPEAFVEAIVLRKPEADALRTIVESIPGGRLISTDLPLAPTRGFARPLLGVVGEATAEIVADSAGAIAPGDVVGLSGLQLRYDAQLRGTPGFTVVTADEAGTTDELHRTEPATGAPLVVTLDRDTQQLADDLLADVDPPSALVALRPSTGELLAVASGPGGNGYSTATLGQYAPGSVFKIATSLALLRAGLTPSSELPCTDSLDVDGTAFGNYADYPADALGDITLRRAFAESCNTVFLSQNDRVSDEALAGAAASLGIGGTDDLGFDAYLGTVGEPRNEVEQAASLIGQGTVLLSPLSAATMAASVEASPVLPVLIESDASATATPTGAGSVDQQESETLTSMMRSAVTSGTADVLADVPGAPVGAKTGTAEYGTSVPPSTHGWMVAVQGDLAVAVFVEDAESGSGTAGPIMRAFLSQVPPESQ
ncbi:MAG: penicillin-binding transpeptidase domain-containing protein, partial [Jiangellales bacterium]